MTVQLILLLLKSINDLPMHGRLNSTTKFCAGNGRPVRKLKHWQTRPGWSLNVKQDWSVKLN